MISNKFLIVFAITFMMYFVLDFIFNNMMLYIVGGLIGGLISEVLKEIGLKAGRIELISLIWTVILIGAVILFYRSNNDISKYLLVVFIAVLLYLIDMIAVIIPYDYMTYTKNIIDMIAVIIPYDYMTYTKNIIVSNIIIGFLVFIKSVILSWIIYTGIIKNRFFLSIY